MQWIEEELQGADRRSRAHASPWTRQGRGSCSRSTRASRKFFPLSLQASATVFHAAGEDWTVACEGWDLTNYGLFTGNDAEAGAIAAQPAAAPWSAWAAATLVIGECGHGFASARWEAAEWLRRAPGLRDRRASSRSWTEYLRERPHPGGPDRHTGAA